MERLIEGKYEVLGKLSEGGMGAVFKVRHVLLDEIRVVKVMKPRIQNDEESRLRFLQEAKMATALKHPNIALVHDFAADDEGTFYMVLEYIEGLNLGEYLERFGPFPVSLALEVAVQSLRALAFLHRNGIVHRDISPENLMLTRDAAGAPLVKLIDLGIAKRVGGAPLTTASGVFVGKVHYGSPEQFGRLEAGQKLDGRSDLYSLGCVLYLLLTASRPFSGDEIEQIASAHLFHAPLAFSTSDPGGRVPDEVRRIVLRALEKRRESRWGSADEMAEDVRRCQSALGASEFTLPHDLLPRGSRLQPFARDEGLPALPGTPRRKSGGSASDSVPTLLVSPPPSRRKSLAWPAVILGLAVVTLLGVFSWHRRPDETASASRAVAPEAGQMPAGSILLTVAPWAEIVEIRESSGAEVQGVKGKATPLRLVLPPGRYRAVLTWNGTPFEAIFESRQLEAVTVHETAPGFSADEVAREYAP